MKRHSSSGLLAERIAGRVATLLGNTPNHLAKGAQRYVREKDAAAFLGISVYTLQAWRSKGSSGLPFTKVGSMVMYSVKELERFMGQRTVERR